MSAILGLFTARAPLPSDPVARTMLRQMRGRGGERVEIWRGDGAILGVARDEWELGEGFSGDAMIVQDGSLVVVADAALYYRADLRQRLAEAGVRVTGETASHLVLAAYRAWGRDCATRLEGDFAFLVYDRETRTAFGARDFAGRRPLFHLESAGALVVASTVAGVTAYPGYHEALNLTAVAAVAAGLLGASRETAYKGVFSLRAGDNLLWAPDTCARTERHWDPPIFESGSRLGFEDAAMVLRGLISDATAERFAASGPTSIWMSGGWDSTAVFAAGQQVLRDRGSAEKLEVISISYPPGDPGREDELIESVARHWNCPVRWVDINDIPFFDRISERAASRDEPVTHVYESWNRALIAASRRAGARVALDGMGGDGLFQVSPVFVADLLWTGRWGTLAREWRAKRLSLTKRNVFKMAVQPLLPEIALRAVAAARDGRALRGHLERRVPDWIDERFAAAHGLRELTRSPVRKRRGESAAALETQWHLETPWVPTILSCTSAMALEEGLEIRSPLYDRRVIEFAATRPREERSQGGETKRLLRRAMHGLLPDHVLAPRTHRTGMTTGYLARSLREGLAPLLTEAFGSRSVLAESGIVDVPRLRRAAGMYLRGQDRSIVVELLMTLHAELWLRARMGREEGAGSRDELHAVSAAVATQ